MSKGFLTYSTTVILQAVSNGYLYGFDIIDITGMPGGTIYPALRRLEQSGRLAWEKASIAPAELRPPRKYYELTRAGCNRHAPEVQTWHSSPVANNS